MCRDAMCVAVSRRFVAYGQRVGIDGTAGLRGWGGLGVGGVFIVQALRARGFQLSSMSDQLKTRACHAGISRPFRHPLRCERVGLQALPGCAAGGGHGGGGGGGDSDRAD
jgi:hypothetical protein